VVTSSPTIADAIAGSDREDDVMTKGQVDDGTHIGPSQVVSDTPAQLCTYRSAMYQTYEQFVSPGSFSSASSTVMVSSMDRCVNGHEINYVHTRRWSPVSKNSKPLSMLSAMNKQHVGCSRIQIFVYSFLLSFIFQTMLHLLRWLGNVCTDLLMPLWGLT